MTKIITCCKDCPFAQWDGYYHPNTKICEHPEQKNKDERKIVVFTRASGWWYETLPEFCPNEEICYKFE